MSSNQISECIENKNFQTLLDKFHKAIINDPKPDEVKPSLDKLMEEAKTLTLTARQSDAIYSRSKNYINGVYGSTSREHKVHEYKK